MGTPGGVPGSGEGLDSVPSGAPGRLADGIVCRIMFTCLPSRRNCPDSDASGRMPTLLPCDTWLRWSTMTSMGLFTERSVARIRTVWSSAITRVPPRTSTCAHASARKPSLRSVATSTLMLSPPKPSGMAVML